LTFYWSEGPFYQNQKAPPPQKKKSLINTAAETSHTLGSNCGIIVISTYYKDKFYGEKVCVTWVLKESIKQKLLVCERKILRTIFGPTKERDGTWRIKTNDELNKLIKNRTIINYIKSQFCQLN
jgi:hypothetical protein